jgi:dTDP-4-dehydrorhamnose reductase (EC 1.1.1.133)
MPDAPASILLLGATGQVATRCGAPRGSGTVHTPGRAAVDLTDLTSVREAAGEHEPDLIVNAAAYTDVDGAEEEPGRAAQINAEAPRALGRGGTGRGGLVCALLHGLRV